MLDVIRASATGIRTNVRAIRNFMVRFSLFVLGCFVLGRVLFAWALQSALPSYGLGHSVIGYPLTIRVEL